MNRNTSVRFDELGRLAGQSWLPWQAAPGATVGGVTSDFRKVPVRAAGLLPAAIHDGARISIGGDVELVARRARQAPTDPEPGLPGMGG